MSQLTQNQAHAGVANVLLHLNTCPGLLYMGLALVYVCGKCRALRKRSEIQCLGLVTSHNMGGGAGGPGNYRMPRCAKVRP